MYVLVFLVLYNGLLHLLKFYTLVKTVIGDHSTQHIQKLNVPDNLQVKCPYVPYYKVIRPFLR